MGLPKVNTPEYRLTIPSTDKEIKFRPFLVQEEKLLLIAQQTGNEAAMLDAIRQLIENCCFGELDLDKMPMFDMEYIFLQIRAKSVGEVVKLKVTCPDDKKTEVEVEVDLSEIQVQMSEDHDARIQLTDDIGLLMAYPSMGTMVGMQGKSVEGKDGVDALFEMICNCMYQIWQGEEVHDCMDYTTQEKMDFISSLNHDQFEKIQTFFDTMPTVKHEIEIYNPNTKKKSNLTLQGMNSFF